MKIESQKKITGNVEDTQDFVVAEEGARINKNKKQKNKSKIKVDFKMKLSVKSQEDDK